MKVKRIKRITIVLILLISIFVTYSVVNAISKARQLGMDSKNISISVKELAKIDHITITTKDVENYKINLKLQQAYIETSNSNETVSQLSDKDVLSRLIENAILYLEAEKQGLVVSDKTVNEYISNMKKAYMNDKSKEINFIREFVNGKGLTLDEYIDSIKPLYTRLMSIGRLRSTNVSDKLSYEEGIEKWNQVKKLIVQQYQSQIIIFE